MHLQIQLNFKVLPVGSPCLSKMKFDKVRQSKITVCFPYQTIYIENVCLCSVKSDDDEVNSVCCGPDGISGLQCPGIPVCWR